jgi:hypothetical protein
MLSLCCIHAHAATPPSKLASVMFFAATDFSHSGKDSKILHADYTVNCDKEAA